MLVIIEEALCLQTFMLEIIEKHCVFKHLCLLKPLTLILLPSLLSTKWRLSMIDKHLSAQEKEWFSQQPTLFLSICSIERLTVRA